MKPFEPFFVKLSLPYLSSSLTKTLVSAVLGLAFLAAHYRSVGEKAFDDWSWFLSLLIATAMLTLYYATHVLQSIIPEMDRWLSPESNAVYMSPLQRILSDLNFRLAGVFFGVLNCGFGFAFGLPYSETPAVLTLLSGYFLAGFVCGMAAWGILGVSVAISAFSRKMNRFDFTSPDRCGGTLFLGEALVVFSSVTLIVGVMISFYILKMEWTRPEEWWVILLKCVWIAFPYLMSLIALFVPAIPINKSLRQYKMEQDIELQGSLGKLRTRLEDDKIDPDKRKELREDYDFQTNIREQLHRMRTWPYGLGANLISTS